jgi:hypothetical protein
MTDVVQLSYEGVKSAVCLSRTTTSHKAAGSSFSRENNGLALWKSLFDAYYRFFSTAAGWLLQHPQQTSINPQIVQISQPIQPRSPAAA